jgi:sodium-dependent dicarboxylate transporter 2/3/5
VDVDAREVLSPGERRFEELRRRVGLPLAPLVFVAILLLPLSGLSPEAHRLAAVMGAVVTLWLTEALPMPLTALAGVSACVLLGVAPAKKAFAPLADPLMLLFIGSFIIARAIFLHGLDRRLAFAVLSLSWVKGSPSRVLLVFGAVTASLSAWISNTATTAMMYAIGLSILSFLLGSQAGGQAIDRRYATGLMLMTSFAASIGGLATPIGTPPNVIGLGFIRKELGVELPFFKWCLLGVPVVVVLFVWLFAFMNVACGAGVRRIAGLDALLAEERRRLGPWTAGQRSTLAAFAATVCLWVLPGIVALAWGEASPAYRTVVERLPESVAAMAGATLLFLLPGGNGRRAIAWKEAAEIDWGVVLLYGGGFALGVLSFDTGLAEAIGRGLTGVLPVSGDLGLLVASTLVAVLVSETTSNTASANMVVPVVIAIARASGADPLAPALGATLGASMGFMLPVSTPCNAIVYGSGHVPLTRMVRYGLVLDVAGAVVIVAAVRLLLPLVR